MSWLLRASYAGQPPQTVCTIRTQERAAALVERLHQDEHFTQITLTQDNGTWLPVDAPIAIGNRKARRAR